MYGRITTQAIIDDVEEVLLHDTVDINPQITRTKNKGNVVNCTFWRNGIQKTAAYYPSQQHKARMRDDPRPMHPHPVP